MNQRTSTTLPRRSASASGGVLNQRPTFQGGAGRPSRSCPSLSRPAARAPPPADAPSQARSPATQAIRATVLREPQPGNDIIVIYMKKLLWTAVVTSLVAM